MSLGLIEIIPSVNKHDSFVYVLDIPNTNPPQQSVFSAVTLKKIDLPEDFNVLTVQGYFPIRQNNGQDTAYVPRGTPVVIRTSHGCYAGYLYNKKAYTIEDREVDNPTQIIPVALPENFQITPSTTLLSGTPVYQPPVQTVTTPVARQPPIAPTPVMQSKTVYQPMSNTPMMGASSPQAVQTPVGKMSNVPSDYLDVNSLQFLFELNEARIRRDYGFYPVKSIKGFIIGGRQVPVIAYEQARDLINAGKLQEAPGKGIVFEIIPLLQPFAGSHRTTNRMVVCYGKDGSVYAVKASYDPAKNKISPLVTK
jgi:uncharacterized protein (UPF0297 family)